MTSRANPAPTSTLRRAARILTALLSIVLLLALATWLRAHTFAPEILRASGGRIDLWPAAIGGVEPLDCDEAAYAHIGLNLARGKLMYRDLTENKPPLGYALYALAVAFAPPEKIELAVRIMSLPYVLLSLVLVWAVALAIGGLLAANLAGFAFALLSTDPALFGNGSNMEHFLNLFALLALASALLLAKPSRADANPLPWALPGLFAALGVLVKQVAILNLPLLALLAIARAAPDRRLARLLALAAGFAFPILLAAGHFLANGAADEAYDDIVRYGAALASDVPPEPNTPPAWARWLTGNADPRPDAPPWNAGGLPWPFGSSEYHTWWGLGSWPLWLISAAAMPVLALAGPPAARVVVLFTLLAWLQVALPGLYWQHYYLLPVPGTAILLGLLPAALNDHRRNPARNPFLRLAAGLALLALLAVFAWQAARLHRLYLQVPPEQLAARYKGGGQWIANREWGRELHRRAAETWPDANPPRLFLWGWQSPLFIYGGFDSVTPHFFTDPVLRAHADNPGHPLVRPRVERILADLRANPPELVFCGYPPFPELHEFLRQKYRPARVGGLVVQPAGEGLHVRDDAAERFNATR